VEHAQGDVFGLARRLPFILARDRTSIGALLKSLQAVRWNETQSETAYEQNCLVRSHFGFRKTEKSGAAVGASRKRNGN